MDDQCVFCSSPIRSMVPSGPQNDTKNGYGYSCNEINPLLKEQPHKFCPRFSYYTCSYPDCMVVVSRRGGSECALQHNNIHDYDDNNSTTHEQHDQQHLFFVLNESFKITLNKDDDKTIILHEHKLGVRFVLIKRSYHSWISFNRIDSGGQNMNIDIEASILFPPQWWIGDELRQMFEGTKLASTDDEIIQFLQNEADKGDKEMRDLLSDLHPRWIAMKIDSFTMNKDDDNKEVEAHLLQLPELRHGFPFNINISIKEIM